MIANYRFDRLSAQDAAFLAAEAPNTHMHVGAVFISESGPLKTEAGGIDIARVRRYVAARLHLIPRYRQRLSFTPLRRQPVWVDDAHFNIEYHVRHTSLPKPGTPEQLKLLTSRITAQQLDRGKPLWELWIVEGFDQGNRFAIVMKVHHCMIDGISGADLMMILMSLAPVEEVGEEPEYIPRASPTAWQLVRDEVGRLATGPIESASRVRELLRDRRGALEALRGAAEFIATGLRGASPTPLNRPIGPHRRFEWTSTDLSAVKRVKNKLGGTVNDVVLAIVAGAVRSFLRYRRVDVAGFQFRVTAPVSMRSGSDKGALGNRVSAWVVPLPVSEPDPLRRLERIRATTSHLRESQGALGADMLSAVTEWTGTTLLSLGTRLQSVLLAHNMIVTNVPGPQIPLYFVGARLLEAYPIVPLFENQALGLALFSYDARLFWGFNVDRDLVPDVEEFKRGITQSLAELSEVASTPTAQPEASPGS